MSTHTIDAAEVYRRTADMFAARVALIGDRWSAPTPCAGWDVRALVHHIVEEDLWTPPLYAGRTVEEVGDAFAGDLLGADPLSAWTAAARGAAEAVRAAGAMDRTVHLSSGATPGREYAMQLAADHLVHAWDLGHALDLGESESESESKGEGQGQGEEQGDGTLAAVRDWFAGAEDAYRAAGLIGPRVDATGDGPMAQLLAMFGRRP